MTDADVVIIGGGAAGFFAAIACAEAAPHLRVVILEKSSHFLAKVRISGGGRCNVTHACFDPAELVGFYPRGASALRGPFSLFQPRDTVAWFEQRGVRLKTEEDGRIFPVTDSSQTIIDCLLGAAKNAAVQLATHHGLDDVSRSADGFVLKLGGGETLRCRQLLLATGGCRGPHAGQPAVSLGHTLEPPVPSLFTFHIAAPWLRELAGVSIDPAEVSVPGLGLRECGPVLITHAGLSGPAILRLSAWGARKLHARDYRFPLHVNWLPQITQQSLASRLDSLRAAHPAKLLVNTPAPPLSARLWEKLVLAAGIPRDRRWADLPRAAKHKLIQQLLQTPLDVAGKTLNQEEFVTCGGVRLSEVNFKTMESRLCPNLFFAGELLDIDALTGGFNFQAAWTTGWIAGRAMARPLSG